MAYTDALDTEDIQAPKPEKVVTGGKLSTALGLKPPSSGPVVVKEARPKGAVEQRTLALQKLADLGKEMGLGIGNTGKDLAKGAEHLKGKETEIQLIQDVAIKRTETKYQNARSQIVKLTKEERADPSHLDKVLKDYQDEASAEIDKLKSLTLAPDVFESEVQLAKQEAEAEAQSDEQKAAYTKKAEEVEASVADLQNWQHLKGDEGRKSWSAINSDASKDYEDALAKMTALGTELKSACKAQQEAHTQKMTAVAKEIADLKTEVLAFENTDVYKKTLADKQRDQLQDKMAIIQNIAYAGFNLASIDAVKPLLKECQGLLKEMQGAKGTFDKITAYRKAIKAKKGGLGAKDKLPLTEERAALQAEFDALEDQWEAMAPAAAEQAYKALAEKAAGNFNSAAQHLAWKKKTEKRITAFASEVSNLDAVIAKLTLGLEKAYDGMLLREIDKARAGLEKDDVAQQPIVDDLLTKAELQLQKWLKVDVSNIHQQSQITGEALKILKDHDLGVEETEAEDAAAQERQEGLTAFKKEYKKWAQIYAKLKNEEAVKNNKTERTVIRELGESALSTAEDTGDFVNAKKMLDRAIVLIIALSEEDTAAANEKVKKIGAVWAKALKDIQSQLTSLAKAVTAAAESDEAAASATQDIDQKLKAITTYFKTDVFNGPAAVLGNPNSELSARLRSREEGLKYVRLYLDYTRSDPVLRHAVANPFGVTNVGTELFTRLREIEYDLQTSVKR